mmetsp:Transcript_7422/g.20227  ORF Transcript_7422/g.20227 Transcript_7422/m.20227 type:complete len:663 (-) Transcript_7422:1613-3601(-)
MIATAMVNAGACVPLLGRPASKASKAFGPHVTFRPLPRSPRTERMPVSNAIGFENAPTGILIGGGVFLTATIAFIATQAMSMTGKPEASSPDTTGSVEELEVIPREDAVIVFGASGRSGRQIVSKLLASGRTVVAAVRSREKALEIFAEAGVTEGRNAKGILFVEEGVDVTDATSLTAELFAGVTSVVVSTGAVFGRDENGAMGYLNGMTPEKVDSQGVAAIANAAAKYVPKQAKGSTVVMPFQSASDLEGWQKLDDVIMGGNSDSALSLSDSGNGFTWSGKLVLEGGGFCGARSYERGVMDLGAYDGISLRVRGSGETLKLNLKTDDLNEPEDTYQATFDVPESGDWADVFIPWHEFVPVKRARSVPDGPPLDPTSVKQFGLVYSRFSFNGFANPNHKFGDFRVEFEGGIKAFKNPKPQIVLISSAGVERNALVGNDEEKRKAEIPIVQLNPGGILNHKYDGEIAVRSCGLPYSVIRPTGMISDDDQPGPCLLEMGQGDKFTGKITRGDVAQVVDATLSFFPAVGKTVEVRRIQADDAQGKAMSDAQVANLYLAIAGDDVRTRVGVLPFPAPVPAPAPVSQERKEEILSDPRVQAAQPRVDAGKAGGRVREATEADEVTPLENVADGPDDEVRKVQAWILAYRKRTLEGKLPAGKEETVNV